MKINHQSHENEGLRSRWSPTPRNYFRTRKGRIDGIVSIRKFFTEGRFTRHKPKLPLLSPVKMALPSSKGNQTLSRENQVVLHQFIKMARARFPGVATPPPKLANKP